MITRQQIQAWLAEHEAQIRQEYFELLRFQSIGADQTKLGDCASCATWIKKWLKPMGFDVELVQPDIHLPPILIAERLVNDTPHTILFYGHYDVQPVDPIALWDTDPFEPTLKGNRVYARGAQDDKGQWFSCLQGLRALLALGGSVPSMRIVLEGQEESGSGALSMAAYDLRQRLAADILMVCDTGKDSSGRLSIVAGLRGVIHFTVTLKGAAYDLHSGQHGGLAPNTAQGMIDLLASLHDEKGAIAVEGFSDRVRPPKPEELAAATAIPFDLEAYEKEVGVPPVGGEEGVAPALRVSFLPTIEVNGIHSGYGGPGSKTVIPHEALAKISCRLVPDQSPAEIVSLLKAHFEKHCPRGMTCEISDISGCEPGFRLPMHSPVSHVALDVLQQLDPRGAVFTWEGASIPIVAKLRDITGAAPLLVGFGEQEDRIHSPNESFSVEQFNLAAQWGGLIIQAFAKE